MATLEYELNLQADKTVKPVLKSNLRAIRVDDYVSFKGPAGWTPRIEFPAGTLFEVKQIDDESAHKVLRLTATPIKFHCSLVKNDDPTVIVGWGKDQNPISGADFPPQGS